MADSASSAARVELNLRDCVLSALDKIVASGAIEEMIEQRIAASIKQVLDEALGKYSDFGAQLKAAVAGSLQINGDLDLPSYNHAVLQIVRAQVEGQTHAALQQQVAERMAELLKPPPESITLEELVDQYREYLAEQAEHGCSCGPERITLHVTEPANGGFVHVYLDPEPQQHAGSCEINMGVYRDEIYSLRIPDASEKQIFAGPLYAFHRSLFAMKVAKTKLVIDRSTIADIELSYGGHDDD